MNNRNEMGEIHGKPEKYGMLSNSVDIVGNVKFTAGVILTVEPELVLMQKKNTVILNKSKNSANNWMIVAKLFISNERIK